MNVLMRKLNLTILNTPIVTNANAIISLPILAADGHAVCWSGFELLLSSPAAAVELSSFLFQMSWESYHSSSVARSVEADFEHFDSAAVYSRE